VAVLAGVVAIADFLTLLTGINVPTQSLGSTLFNGLHRLQMAGRNTSFELVTVGRAVLPENLGQVDHGRSAIT
jgi:hypothetical protein